MPFTRFSSLWVAALFFAVIAEPQSGQRLEFEAVSVKPHGNSDRFPPPQARNGQFSSAWPLESVIAMAYGFRIQGPRFVVDGPAWLYSHDSAYDLEGTVPSGALPAGLSSEEQSQRIQKMLQALLEDRFHLKVHRERREMPVYTITVAEGGVKLPKADIEEKDCPAPQGTDAMVACHRLTGGVGRGVRGRAATIAELASYVQSWTKKPLIDQTGVSGLYRVETSPWLDPGQTGFVEGHVPVSELPTLPAWFERMGLKMETRSGQVEVLVVDQVEKP